MRLKYLYIFYFEYICRSKLYLSASVAFVIFLIIRVIVDIADEGYGQLPAEIIVIVQMITILYIVYFYRIFSNELKFGVHDFFVDGYKILIEKMTALILVHISLQTILMLIVYVIFTIVYVFVGVEWSTIYVSLLRFLIDYMFTPFLFTVLVGMITALIFGKNKISIFFILLIWFFSGVINQEIFYSFFETVGANDWETLLSIGPNSIDTVYYSYIGFNLNFGLEIRLFTWLTLFIAILLIVSIKWAIVKREKKIILSIVFFLLCLSIGSSYLSVQHNAMAFNTADLIRETTKYEHMQRVNADLKYDINAYNIELEGNTVRAELKFDHTETDRPSFQLYNAYPINEVLVDGEKVPYSRKGDIVKIQSKTDKFKEIVFNYKLMDTALVPYSKNRTVLLSNHAWYPKKRDQHVYEKDVYLGGILTTNDIPVDESYNFQLIADNVLFTNIDPQDHYYKGEASGLSIIKGQGNTFNYKDYDIIYPADWANMSIRIQEVITRLETVFEEIKLIAPMKVNALPSKLVFTNEGVTSFINNDHFVYTVGGAFLAFNDEEIMKDFEENLIVMTVEPKGNREMYNEWINMCSQMIKKKMGFQIYEPGPTIDLLNSSFEEEINIIHEEFYLLSTEEKRTFLEQWYLSMDDTWTWEDVDLLLKERKTD